MGDHDPCLVCARTHTPLSTHVLSIPISLFAVPMFCGCVLPLVTCALSCAVLFVCFVSVRDLSWVLECVHVCLILCLCMSDDSPVCVCVWRLSHCACASTSVCLSHYASVSVCLWMDMLVLLVFTCMGTPVYVRVERDVLPLP